MASGGGRDIGWSIRRWVGGGRYTIDTGWTGTVETPDRGTTWLPARALSTNTTTTARCMIRLTAAPLHGLMRDRGRGLLRSETGTRMERINGTLEKRYVAWRNG